jgi:threonine synthase
MTSWSLACSNASCAWSGPGDVLTGLCPTCRQPVVVRVPAPPGGRARAADAPWSLYRYRDVLPVHETESVVTLGEGMTPLLDAPTLANRVGVRRLWIKDEGVNPTASFKARGMALAVTRARAFGVPGVVVPTAGNAGAALAAYCRAAGLAVRIWAPATTPPPILSTIRAMGVDLVTIDGHIGDCGALANAYAQEHGWFNVATVREPYRVEGMKTMGYEIAEQLGWRLPDAIVYPTGGGEGTIGIWKAFAEMHAFGWLDAAAAMPRMIIAQAAGCAPLTAAFHAGAEVATPEAHPVTYAAGLRVPGPLGDRLVLRTLRESRGEAMAVDDDTMRDATLRLAAATGVDAAPEGGCALAVLEGLVRDGRLSRDSEVVLFNTGSGASYRW